MQVVKDGDDGGTRRKCVLGMTEETRRDGCSSMVMAVVLVISNGKKGGPGNKSAGLYNVKETRLPTLARFHLPIFWLLVLPLNSAVPLHGAVLPFR
jgi:hypothetical protein